MSAKVHSALARLWPWSAAAAAALLLAACGGSSVHISPAARRTSTTTATQPLPGTGKPQVTIGDKNFTEQFLLGQLYDQALTAQGFSVVLNPNIGPTEVTIRALQSGSLDMYPEYVGTWDSAVAGYPHGFRSAYAAYQAAQDYALAHGLELLNPTPFSDTNAIATAFNYAAQKRLTTIRDLRKVDLDLVFGGPPQLEQSRLGLPALERAYDFVPKAYTPLDVGGQYQALDNGTVQAAYVNTTDGQLLTGNYTLLRDPRHVFGWGNVVPVISAKTLEQEGPVFAATINKVSALLTTTVMRQLNSAVDVSNEEPMVVAKQFLVDHGLIPAGS